MKNFSAILLLSIALSASSQNSYQLNSTVNNFTISRLINAPADAGSLKTFQKEITILDFFATWCVPCIKALPNLSSLKNKYPDKLSILLVSTEEEERLKKFVAARNGFVFPVVVDANSSISNLFQPPSFPYTVVLNNENKIIAITDAGSITEADINAWLAGKNETKPASLPASEKSLPIATTMNSNKRSDNKIVALSQDFMYAAKTGDAVESFIEKMKNLSYNELKDGLQNDDGKKAFWINAYNGYIQSLLRKNPDAYQDKRKFFKSKQIELAGKTFSLDDIEHGILRRSKIKISLGYLNKLFPGKTERDLRVRKLDYRIHFALNCGAKSCPPVAFYDPSNINTQLDVATTAYLTGEVVYDEQKNTLGLPAIMGWFRHDFGTKRKMLRLVKLKGLVPQNAKPSIHFNDYDWELHLNNFQN